MELREEFAREWGAARQAFVHQEPWRFCQERQESPWKKSAKISLGLR